MSSVVEPINRCEPIYERSTHNKGVENMATQTTDNQLRPELAKVVEDILGLRALSKTTGFLTFKSQKQILEKLTPEDAAIVGHALAKVEQQQK